MAGEAPWPNPNSPSLATAHEPRVISSKPGADRDRGLRMHRGVDVDAAMHEPVLAMADGVVSFAGVDLPGRGSAVEPVSR